ncbi:MAG: acyl-phosphate glycerol 3-phosphate acyltransferase [Candidatus Melainabacteria bacterium RIFOXYA12_FULL_32_12]|nr:MAG: acyl-phosphate glycerol 3-phosphate acyltransferase [Candidatus Melainabacteria bacterium GWF2_32_7]OGI29010.1 MAG: acyl-phosphate glycerol 3-phosphate acyltransferase [Candidatus Melainabacteria bacterium RIFOXYA12_FULL_32_12]
MDYQYYLFILAIVTLAYIIGSIPTGYILVKLVKGLDIRQIGSGSTGATNVKRVLGTWAFILVMFIDALKGYLPVIIAKDLQFQLDLFPQYDILPILVAVAVIIGHSRSVFLKFTGGKSVASGVGTIFGLSFPVGLITALTWVVITYLTKYVSVGSIVAVLATPIWMIVFHKPTSYIAYCLIGGLYITLYLHRENIKRLISGNENKIRE